MNRIAVITTADATKVYRLALDGMTMIVSHETIIEVKRLSAIFDQKSAKPDYEYTLVLQFNYPNEQACKDALMFV